MKQTSLGLRISTKRTCRREFPGEMDRAVLWADLMALIEPNMPEGKRCRPPFPVGSQLSIHFMPQWFTLSDPAMEEAVCDIPLFRDFAGLGGWDDSLAPSCVATMCWRRRSWRSAILATFNCLLGAKRLVLRRGTVVDATLISAPSSTKNPSGEHDPEMLHSK